MSYAIITLGGKQYVVKEGQKLLVDRLPHAAAATFHPAVLFVGGDGQAELAPKGIQVTARVVEHSLGEKIRIGKYKAKLGYKRHNGHRSRLSRIEIESIGRAEKPKAAPKPKAAVKPKAAPKPKAEAVAVAEEKPKAAAKPRPAAPRKKKTEAADGA